MSETSSNSSFSQLAKGHARLIESILGVNFSKLISQQVQIEEMITVNPNVDYHEMLADLYKPLKKKVSLYGHPSFAEQLELVKSIFVELFVSETLYLAKENNEIFDETTITLAPECLPVDEANTTAKDRTDYAVSMAPDALGSKSRKVIIIEVNRDSAYKGLPQCFLGMERAFRTNGDGRTVYGAATNSAEWLICAYKGKLPPTIPNRSSDWQISKGIQAFDYIATEKAWKAGSGANLAKVLYTIFDQQIKITKEPPEEPIQSNPMSVQEREQVEQLRKEAIRK